MIRPDSRQLALSLFVHGSDLQTNHGIHQGMMIQAQPRSEQSKEFEFRAKFTAPPTPGNYVIDLDAQDMSNNNRVRGEDPKKRPGIAIFRRELSVK